MRRLRLTALLTGALTLLACREATHGPAVPTYGAAQLDLVLLTIDTLRADRLPVYGYSGIATPHLDALARDGVVFAQAATTVPFTLPAHTSMLTGLYPPRHGVRENVGYVLPEEPPTLAERLREAGYATAGFVSAFVLDGRWGIGRGFERYFDDFEPPSGERGNLGDVQRDGAETVAAALAWLDERPADRPFFLWLHLYEPHDPYEPPEPFASRYAGRPYEGEIAYADELLGRFLAGLAARGLDGETAIALTGDHGEGLGDHGESFHGYFVYDSTVRVPLLLRLPDRALTGRVVEEPVSHVDLLPTFLELAGQVIPGGLDGASLLPLAAGAGGGERLVYSESLYPLLHYGWAPLRAARRGGVKYIEAPQPELYELATDPAERRNVVRTQREAATQLQEGLAVLRERLEAAAAAGAAAADLDESTLASLRALGYLAGEGGVSPAEEDAVPRADPKEKIALHRSLMAAQSALGAGEEAAAERHLREALAQDPGILDAHQMLGGLAAQQERYEEAIEHFRAALALDAEHKASLFGLANAYRRLGRAEEALVGFRRLLALSPQDSKAALAAAELLVAGGERDEALAVLEEAASAREAPAMLSNQLGELLVLAGRREEARARFEQAAAANPELAQPHFNLAVLAEEAGDGEAAIGLYERALERAPRHFQAQFNLGRLYGERGELNRQQRLWEAAIESNPDFARGYFYLAKLLMDRGGDLARAEELTREGLARDREHAAGPLGYYLLADLLNRRGRPAEAEAALRQGRALESSSSPS